MLRIQFENSQKLYDRRLGDINTQIWYVCKNMKTPKGLFVKCIEIFLAHIYKGIKVWYCNFITP